MSAPDESARIVQLSLSSALSEYLERVRELGAVESSHGGVELNPTLQPVLQALHHVLAGGEVTVHVTRQGLPDIYEELQERAARAVRETNALNQPPGVVVVTAV
jgi:hypothetical protein